MKTFTKEVDYEHHVQKVRDAVERQDGHFRGTVVIGEFNGFGKEVGEKYLVVYQAEREITRL